MIEIFCASKVRNRPSRGKVTGPLHARNPPPSRLHSNETRGSSSESKSKVAVLDRSFVGGPRTIVVAIQAQRQKFQQLVLRTFYLANAAPKDIVKVVQTAIPAQPGRSQTIVLQDEATNSVTIRDTEENIRLIGQLIKSLDLVTATGSEAPENSG